MNKKAGGLGRGLGALFGDAGVDLSVLNPEAVKVESDKRAANKNRDVGKKTGDSGLEAAEKVVFIDLGDIKPNTMQPRKSFSDEALEELASSIKEHGVIQPVLLRPSTNGYELVAGERRWRAARMAGLRHIPAIIRELSDEQNSFYALIENMQREDLNSIEEALGLEEMMKRFDLNQEQAAKVVGKSRPYVTNALRLLKLPTVVQEMVASGALSAGHARTIAGLEGEELQIELANKVAKEAWSVRRIESYASARKKPAAGRKAKARSKELEAAEQQMARSLGTKVKIEGSEKRGKIVVEYYSRSELERLIDILDSQK